MLRLTVDEFDALTGEARALGRPVAAHVRDRLFKRSAAQRRELLVDEAHRQIMAVMNNLHQLAVLSEIGAPCGSDIQHALRHVVSIYRRLGSRDQAGLMLTADILLKLRAEGVILNAVTRQWNRKQRELWNRTELLTAMAGVLKTLRLLESTPTATPQKASSAPAKALPMPGSKPVPKAGVKPTLRLKPLPPGGRR
ncbi:MAG: hypothetical protein O9288_17065 [Novosphingobium sp.]|uniref:hypothetical protein n=1 Tax=Novosphingobium sp. TaxID=1874826 RepID=UPI0022CC295E|nr:hypothetical protein [Novosphingobium sp.]MCZ8036448.1 hypothetical protein [Novosphingobium sp.]